MDDTTGAPRTLFRKIWDDHVVAEGAGGQTLIHVDRHFVHEGSFHAFNILAERGASVRAPGRTFGVADHYVPTGSRRAEDAADEERRALIELFDRNTATHGIDRFTLDDPRQGIVHVVGPEQGLTQPGLVMVCGDSHTATHGALGALAFGIGASQVSHVLATQTLWMARPASLRITIDGPTPVGVTAKDIALTVIAHIGAGGGVGHAIEYSGEAVRALSIEGRLTLCNLSIEAGARAGLIAPDETTFAYLAGRPYAPKGAMWRRAVEHWRTLPTDADAAFDAEVAIPASEIAPMVTWGTSPEQAVAVTGRIPDPAQVTDADARAAIEAALAYMDLAPGQAITDIAIDRVFVGSCTNARIEDLRAVAAIARGRHAVVPTWVVPGSSLVKAEAEREGLDRIFRTAGFEWRESGCSMCVAINGDVAAPGERTASTTNRNFVGRQGERVKTHLVSPAMAAAAAVTGRLTDVRTLAPSVPPAGGA